tara:strand:- start:180 stop:1178 length:999 start_codon:yes stop_codon:yes gene_type:complete
MKVVGIGEAASLLRAVFNQNPCAHPAQLSLSASREQIATLMQMQERKAFNPALISLGGLHHLLVFKEGTVLMAQQVSGDRAVPRQDDSFRITPVVFDLNRSCRPRDSEPFFLSIATSGNDTRLGIKKSKAATRHVNISGPDHPNLPRFDEQFRAAFLKHLHEEVVTWVALIEKTLHKNLKVSGPQWPAPLLTHGNGLSSARRAVYRAFLDDVARYVARSAQIPHPVRISLRAPLFGQDGTLIPEIFIGSGQDMDTALAEQIAQDLIGSRVAPASLQEVMPVLAPDGEPIPVVSDLHSVASGIIKEPVSNHQMMTLMARFQAHHRKIEEKSLP